MLHQAQDTSMPDRSGCQVCGLLERKAPESRPVDVVFLSHPPYGSSLFSLWWRSSSPKAGWTPSWWMRLAGPVLSLVIPVLWPLLRQGSCVEVAEDVEYSGVRMQNWVMANFGYQYVLQPFRRLVAARIKKAACMAESRKVSVLCLGALNKAEWMNNGGLGLLHELKGSMRVVHGNTMTAAAVCETARELFGPRRHVFVTGASSS
ncbi:unnamed protein product, partial [Effrenium voratum]